MRRITLHDRQVGYDEAGLMFSNVEHPAVTGDEIGVHAGGDHSDDSTVGGASSFGRCDGEG